LREYNHSRVSPILGAVDVYVVVAINEADSTEKNRVGNNEHRSVEPDAESQHCNRNISEARISA
jgi:hypothetical protein